MNEETKKESVFDKLYGISKEALQELKKPLVKRRVQRTLEAKIDSLKDQEIQLQEKEERIIQELINEGRADKDSGRDLVRELLEVRLEKKANAEILVMAQGLTKEILGE